MVVEIPLTQGKVALVDDEDAERVLAMRKWWAARRGKTYYAVARVAGSHPRREVLMHRFILGAPPGTEVDHCNGNGCDNRRDNIRVCSHGENQRNVGKWYIGGSRYLGVSWFRRTQKWRARICVNSKHITLGYFNDEVEAARAYDEAARKYHGEFATLNFPQEGERGALP